MQIVRLADAQVTEIAAKSVLNRVTGMPFAWSINPYAGCAHQCVFCYARGTHRYRDLDGVDAWGGRLFAKVNAAAVVRRELARPGWRNEEVAIGTATDPYQPIEGKYRITRGILAELSRARTPMHLLTRSGLIVRDLDILSEYAARAEISIAISLPTLDAALARELEPTVAAPRSRLAAIRALASAGVRVGVGIAPVVPGLTDGTAMLREVLEAAAAAGAGFAWHGVLNLGEVTREAWFSYLDDRHPGLRPRYETMYRTRYAPAAYTGDVKSRFAAARAGVRFEPPARIEPAAALPELSLFA